MNLSSLLWQKTRTAFTWFICQNIWILLLKNTEVDFFLKIQSTVLQINFRLTFSISRCRVGENWWYRGEHCEEYVSEPLVVGIAIASVAGFLFVASGVLFFLARTLRDQYDKEESGDPVRWGLELKYCPPKNICNLTTDNITFTYKTETAFLFPSVIGWVTGCTLNHQRGT